MRLQVFGLENLSDEDLVIRAREGSQNAMKILVERYRPLVNKRTRIYFLTGSEKEDLSQEAMLGLYKAIKNYNSEKEVMFCGFAEICVSRAVSSAIKRYSRFKHGPLNNSISFQIVKVDGFLCSKNIDPLLILLHRERMETIYNLLTKSEREIFRRYLAGFSYSQISSALKVQKKTIDNAIQRIRRKIKKFLKEDFKL